MEPIFVNPFNFAFLAMPFIVAFIHRNLKGIWLQARFIVGYAFVGWFILFAASWYADAQWADWLESLSTPSTRQIELFNKEEAMKGFYFLFGWPISLAYVCIVWGLFRVVAARFFRRT